LGEVLGQLHALGHAHEIEGAEEQRVHQGDGLGAHGQYVSHDAAYARGRTAVRLDGRGMVMALDPERVRVLVIEGHHPRVPLGQDIRVLYTEDVFAQEALGGFVAAVLAPRLGDGLELDVSRQPPPGLEVCLYRIQLLQA